MGSARLMSTAGPTYLARLRRGIFPFRSHDLGSPSGSATQFPFAFWGHPGAWARSGLFY